MDRKIFKTFAEVYDFQSQYGLDLEGYKTRLEFCVGYYMEVMQDGEFVAFTENDYKELIK